MRPIQLKKPHNQKPAKHLMKQTHLTTAIHLIKLPHLSCHQKSGRGKNALITPNQFKIQTESRRHSKIPLPNFAMATLHVDVSSPIGVYYPTNTAAQAVSYHGPMIKYLTINSICNVCDNHKQK